MFVALSALLSRALRWPVATTAQRSRAFGFSDTCFPSCFQFSEMPASAPTVAALQALTAVDHVWEKCAATLDALLAALAAVLAARWCFCLCMVASTVKLGGARSACMKEGWHLCQEFSDCVNPQGEVSIQKLALKLQVPELFMFEFAVFKWTGFAPICSPRDPSLPRIL